MAKKNTSISLPNSNLYLKGKGNDTNGNSIIKLHFPNQRAFSIQTNGSLPKSHWDLIHAKSIHDLKPNFLATLEKEVAHYVANFGSKKQKDSLIMSADLKQKIKRMKSGGAIPEHMGASDLETFAKGGTVLDKSILDDMYSDSGWYGEEMQDSTQCIRDGAWEKKLRKFSKNPEVKKLLKKIDENGFSLWEDSLEDTFGCTVTEDVYNDDGSLELEYNGWYEDLKKLTKTKKIESGGAIPEHMGASDLETFAKGGSTQGKKDQAFYDFVDSFINEYNVSEQTAFREAYDELGYKPKFARDEYKKGGKIKKFPVAIKRRVEELNDLIKWAEDKDNFVYSDMGSTWGSYLIFKKPVAIKNQFVYVEYDNGHDRKPVKERYNVNQESSLDELKYTLSQILRAYRKAKKDFDKKGYFKSGGEITLENFEYDRNVDYMSVYQKLPKEIRILINSEKYSDIDELDNHYEELLSEIENLGWTFEHDMSGGYHSLRPIGEPEPEFKTGGKIKQSHILLGRISPEISVQKLIPQYERDGYEVSTSVARDGFTEILGILPDSTLAEAKSMLLEEMEYMLEKTPFLGELSETLENVIDLLKELPSSNFKKFIK
jgi:hypothetical protein